MVVGEKICILLGEMVEMIKYEILMDFFGQLCELLKLVQNIIFDDVYHNVMLETWWMFDLRVKIRKNSNLQIMCRLHMTKMLHMIKKFELSKNLNKKLILVKNIYLAKFWSNLKNSDF